MKIEVSDEVIDSLVVESLKDSFINIKKSPVSDYGSEKEKNNLLCSLLNVLDYYMTNNEMQQFLIKVMREFEKIKNEENNR